MVVGDGPEYQRYMQEWMAAHPGPWHQCQGCGGWRLTMNPKGHCPFCPPVKRERKGEPSWVRRGGGDEQGHVRGPYGGVE